MKNWLVDVPVQINIWIRPELQKKQWMIIKEARPSILFIISDGGRNELEWESIYNNRKLIDESIDWDCEVYKLYEDKNNGLYTTMYKMFDLVWSKVDRCIFLEDDHIPSLSYFRFCAELLEKYKDDQRIEAICGFNNMNTWDAGGADYFFSRRGAIWGIATWKDRLFGQSINDYKYDEYFLKKIEYFKTIDEPIYMRINGYKDNPFYDNHIPGDEFWHQFNVWAYHRLFLVASNNMITCEGATSNSAHACEYDKLPEHIKPLFNSKRYEILFPLNHPNFIINDENFAIAVENSLRNNILMKNPSLFKRIFFSVKEFRFFRTIFRKIFKKKHSVQEKSVTIEN